MSDGRQMASTACASVVALPVVDPGSWPRPAGCLPRRVRPRRAAQRLPSRPVCPDRCCRLRLVEPAKELARLPHLFPGRIDWPSPDKSVASSAEFRERAPFLPRFRLSARSCKVPCSAYSRGVGDLILRTISSLSLRTPPQPLSHASAASHFPNSTHTRLSHPAVWSWQVKSGSSTSSLAMIPESIVFSLTRHSQEARSPVRRIPLLGWVSEGCI